MKIFKILLVRGLLYARKYAATIIQQLDLKAESDISGYLKPRANTGITIFNWHIL